jgi:hypothetical protein
MDRLLIWSGLCLAALGLLMAGLGALLAVTGGKGGRLLPGDIVISRPGLTFVFPLATGVLLSALLTVIVWAITAWRR